MVAPLAAAAAAVVFLLWPDNPVGLLYAGWFVVIAVRGNPWLLRRRRARAEAALAANGATAG